MFVFFLLCSLVSGARTGYNRSRGHPTAKEAWLTERTYICIDLKSFYASVECAQRGLDPMTTNLVVADESRTEKTICLAVSPALKSFGIPGRPRLFEVAQRIRDVNGQRLQDAPEHRFTGESHDTAELASTPGLAVSYLVAVPHMALYMQWSTRIYSIYLRHVAPEDIHVYSIDEVFIDATNYLWTCRLTPHGFAMRLIRDVLTETGITATAGIGTNMYLSKVAMDIVAKRMPADRDGVRIAELNEQTYRKQLWGHRPLTDFWRIGGGYAARLERHGLFTMGDIARCSLTHEDLLYQLFGVNAELLIDHAWGWEPCMMVDIKGYRPEANSLSSGQVLHCPYSAEKARIVVREMVELLALDLIEKGLMTDQMTLTIGYDIESLTNPEIARHYHGAVTTDFYGRQVPQHAHGTANLSHSTSSARLMTEAVMGLFDGIVHPKLLVRRITIGANRVVGEGAVTPKAPAGQLDLFTDWQAQEAQSQAEEAVLRKERSIQEALVHLRNRFGRNAVLKGMSLQEGATARQRNEQIGGHRA